jgi:UDP-galactopyranose mutase
LGNHKIPFYQKAVSVNYVSSEKFTRITEHKYFTNQQSETTTITKEYPQTDGEPFYPIPNDTTARLFNKYKLEAEKLKNIEFVGRLAEYKYYNMDQVVERVINLINSQSVK